MNTHNITFDNADKPILSLCLRSKIGFPTTERINAALASVQIDFFKHKPTDRRRSHVSFQRLAPRRVVSPASV